LRDRLHHLTRGVAIYGAGDAAIQVVNFCLLAVYVKNGFLRENDFGALALLIAVETFAKVISRWGLDGAFMRFYGERADGLDRRRLATTIFMFLAAANVVVFTIGLALSPNIARVTIGLAYLTALQLVLVNTFLMAFTFLPFHAMRLRNEAVAYSALTFTRSIGTLVLRIALVIGYGLGVTGYCLADLVMTLVLLPMLWPAVRPLLGGAFSLAELRTTMRFGLPRVPHGLAQQALEHGNKVLLSLFIPQALLGVYQNGTTLGTTGIKFFTSAFETAWAPFYYATARQADAKDVFRKMTTYGVAALTLLVAGTIAIARDVVLLMLTPDYLAAVPVIPLAALAVACQGVYLLTSIGLNLTSRTEYYPVAAFAAAGVGLGSGVFLMSHHGLVGAAAAFLAAYATQAVVAFALAQRFYPISYERGRLARVVVAGIVAGAAGVWALPAMPAALGVLLRGSLTVVVYVAILWVTGFLRPTERAFMREIAARFGERRRARPVAGDAD
jgi:O-antigen/teichoic acid export membrane protein